MCLPSLSSRLWEKNRHDHCQSRTYLVVWKARETSANQSLGIPERYMSASKIFIIIYALHLQVPTGMGSNTLGGREAAVRFPVSSIAGNCDSSDMSVGIGTRAGIYLNH